MKNYLNLFTLFFTSFVFSQAQITYTSVRLADATESSYLELEEFWAEIHENLIKDDYASFWAIWKVEQDSEKENQSDYLIMNIWKDSIQKAKSMQLDLKEYAMNVYKGKLSKSKFNKKWDIISKIGSERRQYHMVRIDNTIFNGKIENGMKIQINAFKALNDEYEQYETEFYKKWHEKGILNGSRKWWEINRVVGSSEENYPSHVTVDIYGKELSEEEQQEFWKEVTFTDRMMWQNGVKTRELLGQEILELVYYRN
ncbi:MAG: hypothetical protein ISP56_02510 [Flavobacteriaceae bacterium]|nr:hypothetical protein [Flavobacteriaceae bacterium]